MERYDHEAIERRWQKRWVDPRAFAVSEDAKVPKERRRYVLDMFPYPSAEGLHVGHPEGYTASDIYARYLRMRGFHVLHPMGFDAFGLPAENYALKTGVHPAVSTEKNTEHMREQIKRLGFSYDWTREVVTSDPAYYKWTQWIFLKLYEHGLAYEAEAPINWCPKDKTGLANEEVIDGCCERCGTKVEKKNLRQWLVRITAYAKELLRGLDKLDWPENIKLLQRNWIGKSEGAELQFQIPVGSRLIFMHGKHAHAKEKWYVDLYERANNLGYRVIAPDLPKTDEPVFEEWLQELEKGQPDESTILIGHSRGCSAILRWLERQSINQRVEKVILVAPALGDAPIPSKGFYGQPYQYDVIRRHCDQFVVIHSLDDDVTPFASGKENARELNAKLYALDGRGHFDDSDPIQPLVQELSEKITVFTTRADTLFGATYLVLAPEHPLVKTLPYTNRKEVEKYVEQTKRKSDLERSAMEKEKTGVELHGVTATNPDTGKPIPIWVADYVLMGYGTGAVMAVPAHDERDFEFAKRYRLPIRKVIEPPKVVPPSVIEVAASAGGYGHLAADIESECWTGDGTMVNSGKFDGMQSEEARTKIVDWLAEQGLAKASVQYKLRDWVFSRQRYWGEPIPILHCEKEGIVPLREEDLPLELPKVERYEPTGTGEGPLANIKEWVNTTCWRCGSKARRETNTMPQWAGSNWYFLRYCDPRNDKQLAAPEKLAYWNPVDLYVGGAEHAVLHLLYSRFIYKFLFAIGVVPKSCGDEPFIRLKNQGLILGEDGQKMSKSRGNVINPDEIIKEYGSDSMRMYEMFMGPFPEAKPWSTRGIVGVRRFLDRVWQLFSRTAVEPGSQQLSPQTHRLIKKVTADIEAFKFNTTVAAFMEYVNVFVAQPEAFSRADRETFLKLLAPFAPHLSEELWERIGHSTPLAAESWPSFDPRALIEEEVTIVIQVNGKVRDQLRLPHEATEEEVKAAVLASPKVDKWIAGKTIRKTIFVPGKLFNIVV